jgi:hypothetical protein
MKNLERLKIPGIEITRPTRKIKLKYRYKNIQEKIILNVLII